MRSHTAISTWTALCCFLLAGAVRATTVAEWSQALATPTLAGKGVAVADRTLSYGHLTLALHSGTLIPVTANGKVVGAYFTGTGSFIYTSTDPLEAATYHTNVSRCTSYDVSKEGGITDSIEGVLLIVAPGAEQLGGDPGWLQGEPGATAVSSFSHHLERFAKDEVGRYRQYLPQALVEPPAQPLVMAEIAAEQV